MSPVYRRPFPAYYWAPTNMETQPNWEVPYCYREPRPEEWCYGKCEEPYWYYRRPVENEYYSYRPKYGESYERDANNFGGGFSRGFARDLRPVCVYPPPPAASGPFAFRPFHPGDQFRHPDEYPMRFVPMNYGSASDPWEKQQVKSHCCGCPNHVCEPETRAMKGDERKQLMDGTSEEDMKTMTPNMKELAGPTVCFNPLEWHGNALESRNQGKTEHPVYSVPVNWNRNEGDKDQGRWLPGNWIPLDMNSKPLGWEEGKNKFPGYWIPFNSSLQPQALEESKRSPFEGNENKFPGYWIPVNSIPGLQGEQKDKENSFPEGKFHFFPALMIPAEDLKMANSQEGMLNGGLEKWPAFVQKFGNEDKKQRIEESSKEKRPRDVNVEEGNLNVENPEEVTKNGDFVKEQKKINESGDRPVVVQEVGRVNEKQRPEKARKETKTRDIPVKQLEEGKSAAEQMSKENVTKIKARDIPVKQLEEEKSAEVQKAKENALEIKARDIPVKQLEKENSSQAQVQKAAEKAAENHKASSPRASKLPPVCLRVDPLPGKKKANGKSSSRSPSPSHKNNDLASNVSLQNGKADASKIPAESKKAEDNTSLKASKHEGETMKVDVVESSMVSRHDDGTKQVEQNASSEASKHADECEGNLIVDSEFKKVDQDLNAQEKCWGITKKDLSKDEATLHIQAAYRGWQVRKLQPLRKLREIAKIRHRMEELKQQILSSEFEEELRRDDKTKAKMSETLMGFLLQLDTIQGSNPAVRDVRKSLAQELVQLQERLDTLVEEARSSPLQPCIMHERKNETATVLHKIDDREKGLDATEDSCNNLVRISSENQESENEIKKDGNAEEKEATKHDSFEIENPVVSNDGKENVFSLEKDGSENEAEIKITNNKESGEENVPVELETEKSDNRGIEVDEIDLRNGETENQDENLFNERKSLVISEEMISPVNEAVAPLQKISSEEEDKLEPALEMSSVEEDKKLEPKNLDQQDSILPLVADNEICSLSILAQEQKSEVSESSIDLDDKVNGSQETATSEQAENLKVIGLEPEEDKSKSSPASNFVNRENYEPGDLEKPNSTLPPAVENDTCISSIQVQDLEKNATLEPEARTMLIEAKVEKSEASVGNNTIEEKSEHNKLNEPDLAQSLPVSPVDSSILNENINASDKTTSLHRGGEVGPMELKAEPGNQVTTEKVGVSGLPLDICESKELGDALPEKTAGDVNVEFISETSSQVVSDIPSVLHSDGLKETNLNKMEKALDVAENISVKGEFAASMLEGSYNTAIDKPIEALITGDAISAMSNTKHVLPFPSEVHVLGCSKMTDDVKNVASDFVGKLVTNSGNRIDLENSTSVHYSEPEISKSERNQAHYKWEEENEKLKQMVEKLVEAEKLQMSTIAQLNNKIKHLESKLGKGEKTRKARAGQLRLRRHRAERNTKNAPALQC